ncbi:MAG: nucleotidyltransferase family protein [Lachnospiraceae bacterium]|nr:nucleotidyltransferase family protein [Lachnospiraceae bacterium]
MLKASIHDQSFLLCTDTSLSEIYDIARQQHLWPMVFKVIEPLPEYLLLPEMQRNEWLEKSMVQIAHQINHNEALKTVCSNLSKQGIDYIILKGLTCREVYPDPDMRISSDEDILIRLQDCRKCDEILKQLGFISEEEKMLSKNKSLNKLSGVRELHYYSDKWNLLLEVHLNSVGMENERNQSLNKYFENAFSHTSVLHLDDAELTMLDPTWQLMHVFAHFFRHFCEVGAGIRQMMDVLLTAQKYQDVIDWPVFMKMLADVSAEQFFKGIIQAGERYLDIQIRMLPEELRDDTINPDPMIEDMFAGGVYGCGESGQRGWSHFVTAPVYKKQQRVTGIIKAVLFPSPGRLKDRYGFLYEYPVLIPVFYVVRIFQLIWEYARNPGKMKAAQKSISQGIERSEMMRMYGIGR